MADARGRWTQKRHSLFGWGAVGKGHKEARIQATLPRPRHQLLCLIVICNALGRRKAWRCPGNSWRTRRGGRVQ